MSAPSLSFLGCVAARRDGWLANPRVTVRAADADALAGERDGAGALEEPPHAASKTVPSSTTVAGSLCVVMVAWVMGPVLGRLYPHTRTVSLMPVRRQRMTGPALLDLAHVVDDDRTLQTGVLGEPCDDIRDEMRDGAARGSHEQKHRHCGVFCFAIVRP